MKVPLSWLREYVRTDATTEQIVQALSISSAEVNGVERHGVPGDLSLFKVGVVLEADGAGSNEGYLVKPQRALRPGQVALGFDDDCGPGGGPLTPPARREVVYQVGPGQPLPTGIGTWKAVKKPRPTTVLTFK